MKKVVQITALIMLFGFAFGAQAKSAGKMRSLDVENKTGGNIYIKLIGKGNILPDRFRIIGKGKTLKNVQGIVQAETKKVYNPLKNVFKRVSTEKRGSQALGIYWNYDGGPKYYYAEVPVYCDFNVFRSPKCTKKIIIRPGGVFDYKYKTLLKGTVIRKTKKRKGSKSNKKHGDLLAPLFPTVGVHSCFRSPPRA